MAIKYKRVLIKVSGEALAGDDRFGVNDAELGKVAAQIKEIRDAGVEVAVVVGGGNFFRGRTGGNIDKPTADYMGMLATVMNGLAVQDALLSAGCPAKLMTAIEISDMAEGHARRKALDYLNEGNESIRRDGTMMLLNGPIVYYNVTAYPDMLCKSKRITYIECSDPAYRMYGCSVGNTAEQFDKALSAAGFREVGSNVYKKSDIFISLFLDGKKKVAYYVIRAEVGNLLNLRA